MTELVRLPAVGDDATSTARRAANPRTPLVLVIDDTESVRIVVRKMLEVQGFSVITAQDGREGLECFRAYRPDLVITDLIMPEREGIETIRDIRREQPDARIIAMSSASRYGRRGFLDMALTLGADAILAKPFTREGLIQVVCSQLPG